MLFNKQPFTTNKSIQDGDEQEVRSNWIKGDAVEIYSLSQKKWFVGVIFNITHDHHHKDHDLIHVSYDHHHVDGKSSKAVKRCSKYLRPIESPKNQYSNQAQSLSTPTKV